MIDKLVRKLLNLISQIIYLITPRQLKLLISHNSLEHLIRVNSTRECYEHFKEIFKKTILFKNRHDIRAYAIQNAISNEEFKEGFYLEFGVFKGTSANFFSKHVKKLYAFDSFEGLSEDWLGHSVGKNYFNLNKKIPKLNSNVEPIVGWVEDTLDNFLNEHNPQINFIHFDMDTYSPTKYALERIKPFLNKGAILIFDELYNYPGWEGGEYKALKEVFKDDEYVFKAFNISDIQAVIQIK